MVENKFTTQGSLRMIFLGLSEEAFFKTVINYVAYIHIKVIHIVLIQACHHTLIQACHHHPSFSCLYCPYCPIYAPCGVAHHPHIKYFDCLYCPPPSFLHHSISKKLLPPYFCPRSSRRITKHRSNSSNQLSNFMKRNRRDASTRR